MTLGRSRSSVYNCVPGEVGKHWEADQSLRSSRDFSHIGFEYLVSNLIYLFIYCLCMCIHVHMYVSTCVCTYVEARG